MKALVLLFIFFLHCYMPCQAQYQDGLDVSFGTKGIVTFSESVVKPAGFVSAALQGDGKIISITRQNVIRLNSDGSIDKTFADKGIFHEVLMDENDTPLNAWHPISFTSIALQHDRKIIVAGNAEASFIDRPSILLLRLMPDGTRDMSFGKNGVVCNDMFGSEKHVKNLAVQPDGKIIISGYHRSMDYYQMLVRYQANGRPDSSFGTNGIVINKLIKSSSDNHRLCLQADGRILAQYNGFGVARYLPDGSLDTSFNHTGMSSLFSSPVAPFNSGMALRPDGKIWMCGSTLFDKNTPFVLGRMNANGSPDYSFDPDGYKLYSWDTGEDNKCRDMLLLPDGKVVLGGKVMNHSTKLYNMAMVRIKENGNTDSSFGKNGALLTQINLTATEGGAEMTKLILQPDNKIIAFGASFPYHSTIVRYESNGTFVKEYSEKKDTLLIYPNPAEAKLYIANTGQQKITAIQIKDLMGTIVYQSNNPQKNEADISGLASGCYTVSVFLSDSVAHHQTLIISH